MQHPALEPMAAHPGVSLLPTRQNNLLPIRVNQPDPGGNRPLNRATQTGLLRSRRQLQTAPTPRPVGPGRHHLQVKQTRAVGEYQQVLPTPQRQARHLTQDGERNRPPAPPVEHGPHHLNQAIPGAHPVLNQPAPEQTPAVAGPANRLLRLPRLRLLHQMTRVGPVRLLQPTVAGVLLKIKRQRSSRSRKLNRWRISRQAVGEQMLKQRVPTTPGVNRPALLLQEAEAGAFRRQQIRPSLNLQPHPNCNQT